MDVDLPPFDPTAYQISFPFSESNGETYLPLLGRDKLVKKINDIASFSHPKYQPIIISTSRGMGKTFLLKMIGLQKMKPELQNPIFKEAGLCGRILSFDFARNPTKFKETSDIELFLKRLMIFYLCLLFDGTQVDNINFKRIQLDNIDSFGGHQKRYNSWIKNCMDKSVEQMIDEYMRLTNLAFEVPLDSSRYTTPPVFLFDEVQILCKETDLVSNFYQNYHTFLSLLLTKLSVKQKPVCICAGTNNGNIVDIAEHSVILPQTLSLTPLVNDYMKYWIEMTNHYNSQQKAGEIVELDGEQDLIDCLAYAAYQVPQLLFLAHRVWYDELKTNKSPNREYIFQKYEAIAIRYYNEMVTFFSNFSEEEISRIILCCSVHLRINVNTCVPGTQIKWSYLIHKSIIFPYLDDCYLFPFSLVWNGVSSSLVAQDNASRMKLKVEEYCKKAIQNLDIKQLFVSFNDLCSCNLYNLGMKYETLFVSSLAVKYYIWSLSNKSMDNYVPFSTLYDFDKQERKGVWDKVQVNLSQGIYFPSEEVFVDHQNLPYAVIHNRTIYHAHHDIILPTKQGAIPVSAKASFSYDGSKVEEQRKVSKTSSDEVELLIWLYLGRLDKDKTHIGVFFLNGSGVCNGLALDLFVLIKKLKSQNNHQQ